MSIVAKIEALQERLAKARDIVAEGKIHRVEGMADHFLVEGNGGPYIVNGHCTCPDAEHRAELTKGWCKHRLAAELLKDAEQAISDVPADINTDIESMLADLY